MAAIGLARGTGEPWEVRRSGTTEIARGFQEDRGRFRGRLQVALLVGALCALGVARIWLSTETASAGSRLTGLSERNKLLRTDLTVAQARLEERRMYGALLMPAERAGFAAAVERRTVKVETPVSASTPGVWSQLGDEMGQASRLVLTDAAFAQGRRDRRASSHGAQP